MTEPISMEEVVSLIFKQPAEFLATLKSEDGEWKPKDEVVAAIKKADKIRLDTIAKGESGKAVRQRLTQVQKFIRENYGVESDTDEVEDHLKLLVEKIGGQAGKEKVVEKLIDLTEDSALNHPIVQKLLKSEVPKHTSELQRLLDDEKKKFREYLENDNRKKLDNALIEEAGRVLNSTKAALDKDDTIRQKQIKRFVAGLRADFNFKLDENGKPFPVDEHGEPLQEGYVEIPFSDLVKRENIFGVHNYDPDKSSPGATSQPPGSTQRLNVPIPADLNAFNEAIKAEKDPIRRKAILDAFKAKQTGK